MRIIIVRFGSAENSVTSWESSAGSANEAVFQAQYAGRTKTSIIAELLQNGWKLLSHTTTHMVGNDFMPGSLVDTFMFSIEWMPPTIRPPHEDVTISTTSIPRMLRD